MEKMMFGLSLLAFATLMAGNAVAQDVAIYPAKGQSQEQMEKDKFDCYGWAKQQTGFDPMQAESQPAPVTQPSQQPVGGERVRGAARGAAVGAVVGEALPVTRARKRRQGPQAGPWSAECTSAKSDAATKPRRSNRAPSVPKNRAITTEPMGHVLKERDIR